MIDRAKILEEAKKRGLIRTGYNFIDYQHGLLINSAYFISKIRKLTEKMTLDEAIDKLIEDEAKNVNSKKGF